jgi:hypothetical protein
MKNGGIGPKITIIIVNWNGKEFLKDCLDSVLKQSYENFKILFVDNNSTDSSVEFVKAHFNRVDILTLNNNYGFAKANNIGIKYSLSQYSPDYFFLLNNDTRIIGEDVLKKLAGFLEEDKNIGIAGCKLVYPDGRVQNMHAKLSPFSLTGLIPLPPSPADTHDLYEVDTIGGAAFFIRRSVVDTIGLFDEGFSPFFGEEIDFCVRAKRNGYLVKMAPEIEIVHYGSQTVKKYSFGYVSWATKKNCLRFMLLNFPLFLLLIRCFCEFFFIFRHMLTGIWERKDKKAGVSFFNLRFRPQWRDNLMFLIDAYLVNIRNSREIAWKRNHRDERLWF